MIRVLLLCRYDRMGASSRLRFIQYFPRLEANGIHVTPAPFFDDLYLRRVYAKRRLRPDHIARYYARRLRLLMTSGRFDLIWLEKDVFPWLPAWLEQPWLQRLPYVLDLDDALFHRYGLHRPVATRLLLANKLEVLARRAAVVVAGNPYIEAWARAAGASKVVCFPTSIDLDRYPFQPPPERQTFTIGWMGQPSTTVYLRGITEVLQRVSRWPGTHVRLVGADEIELPGVRLERHPWAECSEAEELAGFDVGIAPLDHGPWEQGKSGYKVVQCMGAVRPVVAARVGTNASLVRDGVDGFLVESADEWVDALAHLRQDYPLRRRMGLAGRTRVEQRYSVQANVGLLVETLRSACG